MKFLFKWMMIQLLLKEILLSYFSYLHDLTGQVYRRSKYEKIYSILISIIKRINDIKLSFI